MNDFMQEERGPRLHRCTMKRTRRGKPRVGDRASCSCGAEYVFLETRFGRDWSPVFDPTPRSNDGP